MTQTADLDIKQAQVMLQHLAALLKTNPIDIQSKVSIPDDQYDVTAWKNLLDTFAKLEKPPRRLPAFLEIIGVSHIEAVSTKALAFFMNTQEAHQLDDLFLKAFLLQTGHWVPSGQPIKTVEVQREVHCGNGRIDLLLEVNDGTAVLIENKLYHHARDNPFESYSNFMRAKYPDHQQIKVLLGFQPVENLPQDFTFVSHFDLGQAVQNALTDLKPDTSLAYIPALTDYLNSIESHNPVSRIGKMENKIVQFFVENAEMIGQLADAASIVNTHYEQQLEQFIELLKHEKRINLDIDSIDDIQYNEEIDAVLGAYFYFKYKQSENGPYDIYIWVGFNISGKSLGVQVYERNKKGRGKNNFYQNTLDYLEQHSIEYHIEVEEESISLLDMPENTPLEAFLAQSVKVIEQLQAIEG